MEGENVIPLRQVDQARPMIGQRCFDDLWGAPVALRNLLAERAVVWMTELEHGPHTYNGCIVACSKEEADRFADERGLGETVFARLEGVVPA